MPSCLPSAADESAPCILSAIGIVVVMGMLIGTLFTLFVLPTIYTLLAADHRPKPKPDGKPTVPPLEGGLAHA